MVFMSAPVVRVSMRPIFGQAAFTKTYPMI